MGDFKRAASIRQYLYEELNVDPDKAMLHAAGQSFTYIYYIDRNGKITKSEQLSWIKWITKGELLEFVRRYPHLVNHS